MKHRHIPMLFASSIFAIMFSCQNGNDILIEEPLVHIPKTDTVPLVVDPPEVVDTMETEPVLIVYDTIVSSGAHRIVFDEVFVIYADYVTCYLEDDRRIFKDSKNPENDIERPEDAEKGCRFNLYGQWSSFHISSEWSPSSSCYLTDKTIIKLKENTTSKTRKISLRFWGYVDNTATITQLPSQNPDPQQ